MWKLKSTVKFYDILKIIVPQAATTWLKFQNVVHLYLLLKLKQLISIKFSLKIYLSSV